MDAPITRLEARQRKEQIYAQAKREQLTPLQAERAALIKSLETLLSQFIAGALPDLKPATLAPFEEAIAANYIDIGPTVLADTLRKQSLLAEKMCQRYEREFNIYMLAEYLPDAERRLTKHQAALAETQRQYERLEVELEPLAALNVELSNGRHMPVTLETADKFTRTPGAGHYVRLMTDRVYRMAWPVVSAIETPEAPLASKLQRRVELQQELMVREQEFDLCQRQTEQQRGWVEAYVLAWTSRLNEAQILAEVRQAIADHMYEPGFRLQIATRFERRYPAQLDKLFDDIAALDQKSRRFLTGFDANYESGRIEVAEELAQRQRNTATL